MRRPALPLAAAALVTLAALLAVVLLLPAASETRAEQAAELAAGLRCPDCEGLSVAESRTAAAIAIRAEIDEQLAAGRSADDVRRHFVGRYGQWILLEPADPLAWWLPFVVLAAGLTGFGAWLRLGRRPAPATGPAEGPVISEADRQRIRDEAEALDA